MAKECKIIHINDGSANIQQNENFHYVESYNWAAKYINRFLSEGWEVKHMVPEVSPAIQGEEGNYNFYKSGWTFYMEREITFSASEPDHQEEANDDDEMPEEWLDEEALVPLDDEMLAELWDVFRDED